MVDSVQDIELNSSFVTTKDARIESVERTAPLSPTRVDSRAEAFILAEPQNAISLPPMDGGFHAYAYLASAFFVELIVWAFPFSYGVYLNYYTTHVFPNVSTNTLALVGSISTGLLYLSAPFVLYLNNRFPWYKRRVMMLGVVLCVSGLLGAAFATAPWQLILTQGAIFSLGGSLLYFPMMTYCFEWFSEKKGLANGVMFSGTGVGGVVVPIVTQASLERYGHRTTLVGSAIAFLIIIVPCFPYAKGRLPVAQSVNARSFNKQFLYNRVFWIIFVANVIQGFGSFIPSLYIPTFASDINMSSTAGTLALSLMNGASAPGLVFLGWMSDFNVSQSMLISSLCSSLSVFFLWGLTGGLGPLLSFSCIYGFMALSWSAMWPRFVSAAAIDDPTEISNVIGLFLFGKGIAGVLSAPVASGLLHPWYFTNKTTFAYGVQGYGPLIMFTGISLLGASLGSAYRLLQKTKRAGEFYTM
ncbi:hypothetical protein VKT23_004655 [Stygiomarasmius scandens]|uniref:MFS general substrate transporter n=1 Tax=Marasmiellus scandens TaxID=2682957 RepID=A0ABR1JX97_9AGAR